MAGYDGVSRLENRSNTVMAAKAATQTCHHELFAPASSEVHLLPELTD